MAYCPKCETEYKEESCPACDGKDREPESTHPAEKTAAIEDEPGFSGEDGTESMSRGKRTFVRVITAVLFFALVWLVVAGADTIANWVKSLF